MNRVTPEQLSETDIGDYDIFVFGSNESGHHGAGAAHFAEKHLGAIAGKGFGLGGNTFAIPTKDWTIQQLDIATIEFYIKRFIVFVKESSNPKIRFLVTKIGCGLAGFTPEEIAPLFRELRHRTNVWLPQDFIDIIDDIVNKEAIILLENLE